MPLEVLAIGIHRGASLVTCRTIRGKLGVVVAPGMVLSVSQREFSRLDRSRCRLRSLCSTSMDSR